MTLKETVALVGNDGRGQTSLGASCARAGGCSRRHHEIEAVGRSQRVRNFREARRSLFSATGTARHRRLLGEAPACAGDGGGRGHGGATRAGDEGTRPQRLAQDTYPCALARVKRKTRAPCSGPAVARETSNKTVGGVAPFYAEANNPGMSRRNRIKARWSKSSPNCAAGTGP